MFFVLAFTNLFSCPEKEIEKKLDPSHVISNPRTNIGNKINYVSTFVWIIGDELYLKCKQIMLRKKLSTWHNK